MSKSVRITLLWCELLPSSGPLAMARGLHFRSREQCRRRERIALTSQPAELKNLIVSRWIERILSTYPAESSRFFKGEQDRFANPVGAIIREEAPALLEAVWNALDPAELRESLDRVVRVRAVQEFAPSEALAFLFDLKQVIREVVAETEGLRLAPDELEALDIRVDRLALLAMDIYVECRERIFEIRVNEIRNSSVKVLERMQEWRVARTRGVPPDDAENRPGE